MFPNQIIAPNNSGFTDNNQFYSQPTTLDPTLKQFMQAVTQLIEFKGEKRVRNDVTRDEVERVPKRARTQSKQVKFFDYQQINGHLVRIPIQNSVQPPEKQKPLIHVDKVPGGLMYCTYDEQGQRHGPAKVQLGKDTIRMNYIHGQVVGEVIEVLFGLGELHYHLVNNVRHGPAYMIKLNGGRLEYHYQFGIKEGPAKETFEGNSIYFTYVKGIRSGLATMIDRNGNVSYGMYDTNGLKPLNKDPVVKEVVDLTSVESSQTENLMSISQSQDNSPGSTGQKEEGLGDDILDLFRFDAVNDPFS